MVIVFVEGDGCHLGFLWQDSAASFELFDIVLQVLDLADVILDRDSLLTTDLEHVLIVKLLFLLEFFFVLAFQSKHHL